jgi:hypothetical protein
LVPLAEVAPAAQDIPGQGRLDALLAAVPKGGVADLEPINLQLPAGELPTEAVSASAGHGRPSRVALS